MQLRASKARIKLFLKHPLYARLYLVHRPDPIAPVPGYLGAKNPILLDLSACGVPAGLI